MQLKRIFASTLEQAPRSPTGKELKKEIARLKNAEETRPKPFEGRTLPHASHSAAVWSAYRGMVP